MRKQKFKIKNILFYFVFFIGLYGSVNIVFFPQVKNYFNSISPLPIIFSYDAKRVRKFDNPTFDFTLSNGEVLSKSLDKDLYRLLKGPHRRKVFLQSILRSKSKKVNEDAIKKVLLHFCKVQSLNKESISAAKIVNIQIYWKRNKNQKVGVECP